MKKCRHDYWFGWDMRKRCIKCGKEKPMSKIHPRVRLLARDL
jgi:hypothetical protein